MASARKSFSRMAWRTRPNGAHERDGVAGRVGLGRRRAGLPGGGIREPGGELGGGEVEDDVVVLEQLRREIDAGFVGRREEDGVGLECGDLVDVCGADGKVETVAEARPDVGEALRGGVARVAFCGAEDADDLC